MSSNEIPDFDFDEKINSNMNEQDKEGVLLYETQKTLSNN